MKDNFTLNLCILYHFLKISCIGDILLYELHLYVFHDFRGTRFLIRRSIGETAFGHAKDGGLALASTPPFERTVLLACWRFS